MKLVEMIIWRLFGFGCVLTFCGTAMNIGLMGPVYQRDSNWLVTGGLATLAVSVTGMIACGVFEWLRAGKDKLK